ncbi:WapI family immunity protein [Mycetocola reblochoni]|uniref:Uncharacterized protein n=2 Tax=Mycetocola reblochoni TaxID=331618 RepID=A0A1R4K312_9MICO|nr:hypothetical protein [Mycetocola reblochoni]RLP67700.1 hypothetical protein D9V30_13225 [Mycetocola reblochoni]SJN38626.1 hypothetical protein FM119_11045 [Mycetocola reblochoni REB411]
MILTSPSGARLDLSVAGYEFPRTRSDWPDTVGAAWRDDGDGARESLREWRSRLDAVVKPRDDDANWLLVRIDATAGGERREATLPCLTTTEARELAAFLLRAPAGADFAPIEPNLRVRVVDRTHGRTELRFGVALDGDVRPGRLDVGVAMPTPELAAAVEHWNAQLAMYPPR